jgi:hypothetical protein
MAYASDLSDQRCRLEEPALDAQSARAVFVALSRAACHRAPPYRNISHASDWRAASTGLLCYKTESISGQLYGGSVER